MSLHLPLTFPWPHYVDQLSHSWEDLEEQAPRGNGRPLSAVWAPIVQRRSHYPVHEHLYIRTGSTARTTVWSIALIPFQDPVGAMSDPRVPIVNSHNAVLSNVRLFSTKQPATANCGLVAFNATGFGTWLSRSAAPGRQPTHVYRLSLSSRLPKILKPFYHFPRPYLLHFPSRLCTAEESFLRQPPLCQRPNLKPSRNPNPGAKPILKRELGPGETPKKRRKMQPVLEVTPGQRSQPTRRHSSSGKRRSKRQAFSRRGSNVRLKPTTAKCTSRLVIKSWPRKRGCSMTAYLPFNCPSTEVWSLMHCRTRSDESSLQSLPTSKRL